MHASKAFTLIELLVVVTIIVVLLALLVPSMEKAIYQAELVSCASRLDAVGSGVITYAMENRRSYPNRDLPPARMGVGNPQYVAPMEVVRPVNAYDMRDGIRGVLNINKMLQCPLTDDTLELETVPVDEGVLTSYAMWWGWYYEPQSTGRQAGMFKIGERFAWEGERFNVLVGDYDMYQASGGHQASHPDDVGNMAQLTYRREQGAHTFGFPLTVSLWITPGGVERGLIDLNHAFTDGSVQRTTGVKPYNAPNDNDSRMGKVPISWKDMEPHKRMQIPR